MLAFTGSRLDRADNVRADADALAGLMNWKARLLKLNGLMPEMDDAGALAWGTLADAARLVSTRRDQPAAARLLVDHFHRQGVAIVGRAPFRSQQGACSA